MKLALVTLLTAFAFNANAGGVLCPPGSGPDEYPGCIPTKDSKPIFLLPGHQFCQNENGQVFGWGFGDDAIAYQLDNFAGMPDPWKYFQAVAANGKNHFVINQHDAKTGAVIGGSTEFVWDMEAGQILFPATGDVYLEASCK